jgi:hypothetical protein
VKSTNYKLFITQCSRTCCYILSLTLPACYSDILNPSPFLRVAEQAHIHTKWIHIIFYYYMPYFTGLFLDIKVTLKLHVQDNFHTATDALHDCNVVECCHVETTCADMYWMAHLCVFKENYDNSGHRLMLVKFEGLWGSHLKFQPTGWRNTVLRLNEDFHLTEFLNVGDLSLVKQDSSMYKSSVQMQGLWSTVAESQQNVCLAGASCAESECDRRKTAVLVMYGV